MEELYQVVVIGAKGEKLLIDLCNTEEEMQRFTVGQLKGKIFEEFPEYEGKSIRLIFKDKLLEGDTKLLSEYGIQHMSVIQLIIRTPGGGCLPPPHPHKDDGLGDKEGETRRSKEYLVPMSKTENKFSVDPK